MRGAPEGVGVAGGVARARSSASMRGASSRKVSTSSATKSAPARVLAARRRSSRSIDRLVHAQRSSRAGTLSQRLDQPVDADRLGQVVVHAGGEAHLAVALHRVGGHRDDARALARRPSARMMLPRRFEAVHLGHLHVHQHHVVGLALAPTRPPRCRSTRGRRGSPSAAGGAARASGSRRCPRPAGCAADGAPPSSGRAAASPAPRRRSARRLVREQADQRVEQLRLADRLGEVGGEQRVGVAGLAPAERAEQHQRQRGPARADAARQRDAVHLRHVHVEDREVERARPASSQRSASAGDSVSRDVHAPLAGLQREHAPVGGVVVDDQHALALRARAARRRSRARRLGGSSAIGATIVKKNVEPLPGPSLSTHMRAAHQLGEALADRQAEAGAAVLARRRRVGLRERLEQPAHALGGEADAGVAHGEGQLDAAVAAAARR